MPATAFAPLKLLSSMAPREVLGELVSRYHATAEQRVVSEAAGGVDIAKRVQGGEAVDVVVLGSDAIDKLMAAGKLRPGSRVDLMKSGIAVAIREGGAKPPVASEEMVRSAVLNAKTLSFSTGPSGVYLEKLFTRWGILEQIRDRIVVPPPGVAVGSLVASGAVEIGFQQLSELLNVPGIEVIGPLPPPIQSLTIFSGAIAVASGRAGPARALLDYMALPGAAAVKQQYGMEAA